MNPRSTESDPFLNSLYLLSVQNTYHGIKTTSITILNIVQILKIRHKRDCILLGVKININFSVTCEINLKVIVQLGQINYAFAKSNI